MSIPPPGLGGGVARTGPPPGFGGNAGGLSTPSGGGGGGGGRGGGDPASIVRAQIVFLLSTFSEEGFDKHADEIRALASTNGPEMYHHFLRRAAMVANPIIHNLIGHSQKYKDDPAAPPPAIQSTGPPAFVWRLLLTEAVRASRDVSLAPHFCSVMLSPAQQTSLPLPSLRIFGLPNSFLFSLTAYTLASPNVYPPNHASAEMVHGLLRQTFQPVMEQLRTPNVPLWSMGPTAGASSYTDDLSLQEARTLILALYPRSSSSGGNNLSRPPTPTNPTAPHSSPLNTLQRATLLGSLAIRFSSPAIILQSLSALSPGGPPRSPGSIPLEDVLFELGDVLTQDEGTVEAVIGRWWGPYLLEGISGPDQTQAITEEASRTIHGLCDGLREGRSVDVHGVVKGLSSIPSISIAEVVRSFDIPTDISAYQPCMSLLVALLLQPSQYPVPPITGLLPASPSEPIWDNMITLLHIIWRMTSISPDAIPLFTMPGSPSPEAFARIVDPPPHDRIWSKAARQQATDIQGAGLWNTLGLIQILVHANALAEGEIGDLPSDERVEIGRMATERLDRAGLVAPELVLIALEKLPKPLPGPVQNIHTRLLAVYLATPAEQATSSQLVFHQLWEHDPENLLAVLLEFYGEAEDNLGRIMDIAFEVEILSNLIDSENAHFALDVAAQASQHERIDLEKWLADGIEAKGHDFLEGIFAFVEHKIRLEFDHQHQPDSVPALKYTLGPEIYSIFIRVIRNARHLDQEDIQRFKSLRTDILIQHPRLLNFRPQSKEEQGFSVAKYSKEANIQVDEMYQHMYKGEMKMDDLVDELRTRQKSDDPRDQELFACALHSLFDEIKFVKSYPAKELTMTGILFGAIIDGRLVKDTAAFVATRYVLDACKSSPTPPHDALYQFGINALCILRASLVDFPGLCRELIEIPALHDQHPGLLQEILAALAEREELDLQGGVKLAFPALKLPILIEEGDDEFIEPESRQRDGIMFIINNIAESNFEAKMKDLLKLFEDQHSRWFAHYFIDLRVSLESNRHEMYMRILESLNSEVFERHVLWETYRKARDLLNSEATINSAAERVSLKTIALWLGRITLARNRPIRMRELSIKDLLIQGFDNKRLIVAVPFVCNLMLSCKDSSVFHPPNPWMVGILRLLVEFYHHAELRLNLKFEIEVLFSKLGVSLDKFDAANLLRTHVPPPEPQPEVPNRLDAELQRAITEMMNGSQRLSDTSANEAVVRMQQMQNEQNAAAAQEVFNRRVDELIVDLPQHLVFNPDYPIFSAPTLQRIVAHSVTRAVKDIVIPVVERSVTIAGISSRDLVQKDFGMEGDGAKMRDAAHMMVRNLAGNLALVTCKEALRTSMITTIRNMLTQNGFTEENMPDGPIQGIVNDNLDAACNVIKTAAMEKATKDIDVNLGPQYAARRLHRDSRSSQPFWDGASFGVQISHSALPDPLRLRTGGLSPAQLRVYEDFSEHSRLASNPAVNGDYANYGPDGFEIKRGAPSPTNGDNSTSDPSEMISSEPTAPPQVVPTQTTIDKFHDIVTEMEKYVNQAQAQGLGIANVSEDVRQAIRAVPLIASQTTNREQMTLVIAQRVVQLLYKTPVPLGREIYVMMLQGLCEVAPKVDAEVKQWLVYADDARKLNVPVTTLLIRAGFISLPELDVQLAQKIAQTPSPEFFDFVAELIRECSLGERALVPRTAFAQSLAILLKSRDNQRVPPTIETLLDDLRIGPTRPKSTEMPSNGPLEDKLNIDKDRLSHYFLEWVRVFSTSKRPEDAFIPYITYLQKEGILSGEDISTAFYRVAINCAVDLDASKLGEREPTFFGVDSLAKLIVLIIKHYGDKSDASSARRTVYYYNKIINIIAYSLVHRSVQAEDSFNQRPWARFFMTMLNELSIIGDNYQLRETYVGCLKAFANSMGVIQPTYAPKFAFGYMSIISHRLFMSKLLDTPTREEGWPEFHRCLMWLLRFLSPFLKIGELDVGSRSIYRGTSRILLVLMHDFPEFLVEYYHTLSTAIPAHCIQLRNIVLCAFPSNQGPLPDHYRRLDQLVPEMQLVPVVRQDYINALNSGNVKGAIDQHVRSGMPQLQAIVSELKNRIAIKSMGPEGPIVNWNHTLLHAAVFYLGTTAVERRAARTGSAEFDPKAPEVALLTNLMFAFDAEGQYYMLSVIADQLRYPSAHTLFFTSFILFLFATSARAEIPSSIPERIGRVLLERVVVAKPHPWGLVVTFIELLDNKAYGFWEQAFVRGDEENQNLFGGVHAKIVGEGQGQRVNQGQAQSQGQGQSQGFAQN